MSRTSRTIVLDDAARSDRILIVGTANTCRSPMTAAILTKLFTENQIPAIVRSAGFGRAGEPADPVAAKAMHRCGLSIDDHRSSELTPRMIRGADLVVTMTREQGRDTVSMERMAWRCTFPLRALARRIDRVGPRAADEHLTDWIARLHQGRAAVDLLREDLRDNVPDPTGQPLGSHVETAVRIEGLLRTIVGAYHLAGVR
jgi:protein-tyrosine-phosphatase